MLRLLWDSPTNEKNADRVDTEACTITNVSRELRSLWHPIGRIDSFGEVPQRVDVLDEAFVVVRLGNDVRVYRDVCPHRSARLSDGRVVDGALECPYHGWQFGADGGCTFIPALGPNATLPTAHLDAPRVKTRYDMVWIALDEPITDIIDIGEWDDAALTKVWVPPVDISASAAHTIDNFLDIAHFPFVHAATFGTLQDSAIGDIRATRSDDGWGFSVRYDHVIDNFEDPLVATGEHSLTQPRAMHYLYQAPFSAKLRLEFPVTGMVNAIVICCQPMSIERTRVHMVMLRDDCHSEDAMNEAIDYELRIFREDLSIIERLPTTALVLERGQVHTRADRHTVEFRRILRQLFS